jgi:hypothetical protein
LFTAIGTIVEADNALREGQFPMRVAPTQISGARYPFFQFYGNFPFTAAGIVRRALPSHDPYLAWKVTTVLALTCGGFFTWRLCRRLTRRGLPSILAGVVFMTAPYMFADFVGRGAFTELVAFNLLPAVMFYAHHAFASPGIGNVCRSAVAWALLGMSHNITYLYAIAFIGLWFLSYATLTLQYARRLSRLIVAGVIQGALVAWYLAPQVMLMKSLRIGTQRVDPFVWNYLSTLRSLLWPTAYTVPMTSDTVTPYLTTQVGVPILLGVVLALFTLLVPRLGWRRRAIVIRAIVLFAAAFLLAWAPVDFWQQLPKVFAFVQFPYRLLMFVVLFGSIATACAFSWLFRMRRRWGAILALVLVGAAGASYLPSGGSFNGPAVAAQMVEPRISGIEDYQLTTDAAGATSFYYPGVNYAGPEFWFNQEGRIRRLAENIIPTPIGQPQWLEVEGAMALDEEPHGDKLVVVLNNRRTEWPLKEPTFTIQVPVEDTFDGTPVRLITSPERIAGGFSAMHVTRAEFVGGASKVTRPGQPPVGVPSRVTKPLTMPGLYTHATANVSEPSIVTFPVLYYPGLLRVVLDGRVVTPGNVGRFVALPLEAGRHDVDVEFTGVRWANAVSLVGWVGVITVPFIRRRQRRREARADQAGALKPTGARFNPFDAIVAVGALVLGVVLVKSYPTVAKYFDGSVRITATADASVDAGHIVNDAFDGDPETAWVAPPRAKPTVTVKTQKPTTLRAIELESRETALWECFMTVRVVLKRNGSVVLDRVESMPQAVTQQVVRIEIGGSGQRTDEVELHFSDPVTTTRDGRKLDAGVVSPGYREIRLDWARK